MNKNKLERFISKYTLGGLVNSVKWTIKDNILSTIFDTPDKTVLGKVSVNKFPFENAALGVYTTDQLQKLLSVLSDNIELTLTKIDKRAVSLHITSQQTSVNFVLADTAVISEPHHFQSQTIPEFETIIDIDTSFINTFIRAKSALPDVETFTIINNGTLRVIIGYSLTNTNRVTIPVKGQEDFLFEPMSFNANVFKEILFANRECTSAQLKLSNKGLAHIQFNIDDYSAEYYIVAVQKSV